MRHPHIAAVERVRSVDSASRFGFGVIEVEVESISLISTVRGTTITPAIKQMAVSFLIVILFLILLVPTNEIRIKSKITIKSMLPLVLLPG